MQRSNRHLRWLVLAAVGVLSLASATWTIVATSSGAFTGTTDNTTNSFDAGTVELVDDDVAAVLFNVSDMVPGQTSINCIQVTYQGSVADPAGVRLYSGGFVDSGTLASFLDITIEEGTGGSFGSCTGFSVENTIETGGTLAAFDSAHTSYATGAGVWDPSSTPVSKTYRFTVTMKSSTPDAQQGESVTALSFVWEVQS